MTMTTHTVSVFRESLKFVNHHWKVLVKITLIPFLIMWGLDILCYLDTSFYLRIQQLQEQQLPKENWSLCVNGLFLLKSFLYTLVNPV